MTRDNSALERALRWIADNIVTLTFALGILLFIGMQIRLLQYRVWNDEVETIVTANMMVAGSRLYSGIFNHHGPMTFMPGYLVALVTDGGIVQNRIAIALLQWAMIVAILRTADIGRRARLFLFLCIAVALTGPYRDIFAHMYKYQVLAGICSAVVIAIYVLPRLRERVPDFTASLVSGFCLGSLVFLAFTYIPAALALGAAGFSRKRWKPLALGVAIVTLLNILFLALAGSLYGFIAYHFYMNLVILPPYAGGGPHPADLIRSWFFRDDRLLGVFTVVLVLGTAWRLYRTEHAPLIRVILLATAIASFGIRGSGFQALAVFYSLLPLGLIFAAPIERLFGERPATSWAMVALLLVKLSGLAPADLAEFDKRRIEYRTPFALIVDANTEPNDRVISYSFNNFDYVAAHRLPASAHFFYLPWQAEYNQHPVLGIKSEPCTEIAANRPKFVQLDRWLVFDKYPWAGYGSCIDRLVARNYYLLPGTIIYARKDIAVPAAQVRAAAALFDAVRSAAAHK